MRSILFKWIFSLSLCVSTALNATTITTPTQAQCKNLLTYFSYDRDAIRKLSDIGSEEWMDNEELMKWDEITKELSLKNPKVDTSRMYAYLYTAQRDAAFLSFIAHGEFVGSIGPVSYRVLQLFFPSVPRPELSDDYSDFLSNLVFTKIKERLDDENAHMRNFPIDENDPKLKELPKPYYGLNLASCKPWLLKDPTQFMAPPPPPQDDPYWMQQAEVVKKSAETSSDKQVEASKFWAGEKGSKSDTRNIANDYMFGHNVSFSKAVCVRSVLAEAGIDANIALFFTKYTYVIKRPPMINPSIPQHVRFPKHPSYPSGHSTWFSVFAIILSHYFPNEKDHWFQMAEEAGQSRIWGGIHYPIDHKVGRELGTRLGNAILQSQKLCF